MIPIYKKETCISYSFFFFFNAQIKVYMEMGSLLFSKYCKCMLTSTSNDTRVHPLLEESNSPAANK